MIKSELATPAATIAEGAMVYVIDDDDSVREAVRALLTSVGMRVEVFSTAQEFFAYERPDVPTCLILDVRLRGQSGLVVQEQIAAQHMRIPIVFMTAHGDIEMSVKAMKAGAADFLAKPFRDQDLLDAVTLALAGDEERREADRSIAELRRRYALLTPRERQVMARVVNGLRNRQIAAEMNLSENTTKFHRNQAMKKMEAKSLVDFVLMGGVLGLREAPYQKGGAGVGADLGAGI
ncbi:response regulator [Paraburkholderia sp. SARCC-3016]|jgi:FixJ family two-component response regulator|uniref:response regulator transcription factor n=1 Tax=Paraburkholderia sp. SARCC-3016 TaxID=3058611 RepID=UPI0028072990|nr:response regulator [Paraburkholderia sp. SARCC-3016]MDQ7980990.1 response regulator [Paraburkholderia sp. SARCC-3016]